MGKGAGCCSGGDDKKSEYPDFDNDSGRKCTDILFIIVFAAFLVGMVAIMGVALSEGDYRRITNGIDYRGCVCGTSSVASIENDTWVCKEDASAKPLGRYAAMTAIPFGQDSLAALGLSSPVLMCVEACPSGTDVSIICSSDVVSSAPALSNITNWSADEKANCGFSAPATARYGYCVPQALENTTSELGTGFINRLAGNMSSIVQNVGVSSAFTSLGGAAVPILVSVLVCTLLGFLFLYLLEKLITCLLLIALFGSVGMFVMGGVMLTGRAEAIPEAERADLQTSYQMNLYGGYVCYGFAAAILIFVLVMRKRIRVGIATMKEASKCVRAQPSMLFVPLLQFLALSLVTSLWLYVAVNIFSAGTIEAANIPTPGAPKGVYRTISLNRTLQYAFLYHLFGYFWITQFLLAMGEIILAGAVAAWYFQAGDEKGNKPGRPAILLRATKRALKHTGSAAFGSLIIAIIKFIRAIIAYIQAKTKDKSNTAVKVILCIIQCYLYCLEKCMKFLNKNAYIQIAIYGNKSFCGAARDAFFLILRNILRIGAVKVISVLFLLLGKLFVMAIAAGVCFIMTTSVEPYASEVPSAFVPVFFTTIVGYIVGNSLMDVYAMTIDTILICYIVDEEISGADAPRYAGSAFQSFIKKTNDDAVKAGVSPEEAGGPDTSKTAPK
eukprot:PLAT15635.1.p2 GENE.PLAT15635.1~~PLAT15635.1.p2  ORF type:complete len:669 (+),score=372.91 PLAT15635.1:235-2241(+)